MAKTWEHNPIGQAAGGPAATGRPTAFSWERDETQHVVYVGQDSQIHELYYKKGFIDAGWKYGGALSQETHAPPAAGNPSGYAWESDGTQHIFYRGTDGQVHEIWNKKDMLGSHWSYGGALSALTHAPAAAGDPFGYVWEKDGTQHIVYRGVDNNIHEIWNKKDMLGSHWAYGGAINASVGAPAAAGDPAGFTWENDNTQHIIYRGVDNQIHELWFKHGLVTHNWAYGGALSQNCGAPQAAGDPMGYAWEKDGTQHIIYRSADGQIQELWCKKGITGAQWSYGGALSHTAGGPAAAGDPWGYAWESDATQHIVYRGGDGQIHELWQRKEMLNQSWRYGSALTQTTHAPAAASDPVAFAWEKDGTQHIVYRATDNAIHELWFRK